MLGWFANNHIRRPSPIRREVRVIRTRIAPTSSSEAASVRRTRRLRTLSGARIFGGLDTTSRSVPSGAGGNSCNMLRRISSSRSASSRGTGPLRTLRRTVFLFSIVCTVSSARALGRPLSDRTCCRQSPIPRPTFFIVSLCHCVEYEVVP